MQASLFRILPLQKIGDVRTQRRQSVEEKAAQTAVKLVFPLVLFIFPSIFVVALGPAMITMFEGFEKYLLN